MKQAHRGGPGRHGGSDERSNRHHHYDHHARKRGKVQHQGNRSRLFDYGELRLVLLSLIADEPRHGYEIIKLIEERSGGSYGPSPGVIYPTLSWLDDMGYVQVETEESGRKRYRVTNEGNSFLDANHANAEELLGRLASHAGSRRGDVPLPVIRAMENFKTVMRLRLKLGPLDKTAAEKIAAALDAAAKVVEKTE